MISNVKRDEIKLSSLMLLQPQIVGTEQVQKRTQNKKRKNR